MWSCTDYKISCSAGITGPVSRFLNDLSSPEHKDAETLGRALFENESFEAWTDVYRVNTFSAFFVTTAFLGLLAKGGDDKPGYTSSVVNITSISGLMKLAQNHVSESLNLNEDPSNAHIHGIVRIQ